MTLSQAIRNLKLAVWRAFCGTLNNKSPHFLIPGLTLDDIDWLWVYNHEKRDNYTAWNEDLFSAFAIQHIYPAMQRAKAIERNKNFLGAWSSDGANVWLTEFYDYDPSPTCLTFNAVAYEISQLSYDMQVPYGKVYITAKDGIRRTDFAMTFGACGLAVPRAEIMFKFSDQFRWIIFGQPTPMGSFYLVFNNTTQDDNNSYHPMLPICHCPTAEINNLLEILI